MPTNSNQGHIDPPIPQNFLKNTCATVGLEPVLMDCSGAFVGEAKTRHAFLDSSTGFFKEN